MWVESFLYYLKHERNYSPKTIEEYGRDIFAFESFFMQKDGGLTWRTLDSDIVRDWLMSMMEDGRLATTVNRRLSSLRSFYRFLLKNGYVDTDPVRALQGPKKNRPLPVFVKEAEMNHLLDDGFFDNSFFGVRDKLILSTFYVTGIRLSELSGLDVCDVDLSANCMKVRGKRNKQRIVPFGDELHNLIIRYKEEKIGLGINVGSAFFVDDRGERLGNDKIRYIVRKSLAKVTTLKKRSPHVLRHTFATAMMNHHADLVSLKELLGHESISTTEIYTHTTFEELKKLYNQAHPRA